MAITREGNTFTDIGNKLSLTIPIGEPFRFSTSGSTSGLHDDSVGIFDGENLFLLSLGSSRKNEGALKSIGIDMGSLQDLGPDVLHLTRDTLPPKTDIDIQKFSNLVTVKGDFNIAASKDTSSVPAKGFVYGEDILDKKANDAAVNTLYQAYFGRDANLAELQNWGGGGGPDTTVRSLEDFLKSERTKFGFTEPVKTLDQIRAGTTVVPEVGPDGELSDPVTPAAPGVPEQAPEIPEDATLDDTTFIGGAGLVKFSTDIDGPGPLNQSTVFYVDPQTKTLRPFLSAEAFNNFFQGQITLADAGAQGKIQTISPNSLGTYNLLNIEDAVQNDGTFIPAQAGPDEGAIGQRYGQPFNEDLHKYGFDNIQGFFSMLKGDPSSGISPELIDEISKDVGVVASYINAFSYGDYNLNDLYRDLKRRQLVKEGRTDLQGTVVIHDSIKADQFYSTPAGQAIRSNPDLTPPSFIGDVDTGLFDSSIFQIPDELFQVLTPPFDFTSPEGQAELDTIKSAYHDVLLQQVEAATEQEKALADESYRLLQESLNRKYGIELSDNANVAFDQINALDQGFQRRGLTGSGIAQEAQDRFLKDIRRSDQRARESQLTEEEAAKREFFLKSATPEQIQALSQEEKEKLGLVPSDEIKQFFSDENLRQQFPDLSDEDLALYQNYILDPFGNYRSTLFQRAYENKFNITQDKKTFQLGEVQVDPETGKVISGSGLLFKKALEEEKAFRPFSQAEAFSKPPVSPTTATTTPSVQFPSLSETQQTTTTPTSTPTTTNPFFGAPAGEFNTVEEAQAFQDSLNPTASSTVTPTIEQQNTSAPAGFEIDPATGLLRKITT